MLVGAVIGVVAACSLHGKLGAFRTVLLIPPSSDNVEHSNYYHTVDPLYFLQTHHLSHAQCLIGRLLTQWMEVVLDIVVKQTKLKLTFP